MKSNYQIIIEYEGTNYNGWQYQKNGFSIQKEIEKAKKLWKFSYKVVKNSYLLDKSGGVTLEIVGLKKK